MNKPTDVFLVGGGVPGADAHIHRRWGGQKRKKKKRISPLPPSSMELDNVQTRASYTRVRWDCQRKEPYDKGGPGRSYDKDFSFFTAVGIKWDPIFFHFIGGGGAGEIGHFFFFFPFIFPAFRNAHVHLKTYRGGGGWCGRYGGLITSTTQK